MKSIQDYINYNTNEPNINESNSLDANEIKGPLTVGHDKDDNYVVIIGKPFTNPDDEQYHIAIEIARKAGYKNFPSFEEVAKKFGEEFDEVEDWVLVVYYDGKLSIEEFGQDGIMAL